MPPEISPADPRFPVNADPTERPILHTMRKTPACLTALAFGPTVALGPTTATAEDWQTLDAPAITLALTARVVADEGGATQRFNEDASTVYTTTHPNTGAWRVERNQYCSQWPPSDRWSCYDVALSADGLDLRFTAGDGSVSVGRYEDLK